MKCCFFSRSLKWTKWFSVALKPEVLKPKLTSTESENTHLLCERKCVHKCNIPKLLNTNQSNNRSPVQWNFHLQSLWPSAHNGRWPLRCCNQMVLKLVCHGRCQRFYSRSGNKNKLYGTEYSKWFSSGPSKNIFQSSKKVLMKTRRAFVNSDHCMRTF